MRRKRINLTESQLFGLIRRAINEDINTGGLIYSGDAAQIHTEEDLDDILRKWTRDNYPSWKKAIAPKIKMGDWILPVKCGDHGSELYDWAVIEYFNSFFPDNIQTEKGQYGTEYGFVWGTEGFLNDKIETATDDFLVELRSRAAHEELKIIEQDRGISLKGEARDQVFDFLYDATCANGTLDYSDSDLDEVLSDVGYSQQNPNESIARRINENVNGYEDWECVLDYIESDGKLRETIDWVIQACVKKAKRGVVLDREHLANCYTLRRLCQIGVKEMSKYYEQRLYLSNEDKRRVREDLADLILSYVDYEMEEQNESVAHRVTESVIRKLRRL